MIFGECPYTDCDEQFTMAVPDTTPAFEHRTCEKCKRTFWEYHSRIEPRAYTEEDFAKEFEVNEENKSITQRS